LLPHNVIESLGSKARIFDDWLLHSVYETNASSDSDILVKLIQLHGYNGVVDGVGDIDTVGVTLGVGVGTMQSPPAFTVLLAVITSMSSNE
jgi:hypothetical protein